MEVLEIPDDSFTGILNQFINPNMKGKVQASVYIYGVDALANKDSFNRSFNASAIGCNKPKAPTTLGPIRLCKYAISLRSAKVKKATATIIGTTETKALIIQNRYTNMRM